MKKIALLIITVFTLFSCAKKKQETSITVYAAASTLEFTNDIAEAFEKKSGIKVLINSASSGTLARQIESGASVDIFISASQKWANYLVEKKMTTEDHCSSPMKNSLVLIAPNSEDSVVEEIAPTQILDKLDGGRLAIGDPDHVPAGKYAKEALISLDIYDTLKDHLLPTQNVRAALNVVEMKECNLGIVYLTDAKKSKKVSIVYSFVDSLHNPIKYATAIIDSSNQNATAFYDFFNSSTADSLMNVYGFIKNE